MAAGDILACRIASAAAHNGWVAEIDIDGLAVGGTYAFGLGTNNNPSTAKIVFTLTSLGYDTTGTATTIQRTVYGTQWVRKPYPNQLVADEAVVATTLTVRVALSEFVYDLDTAVTVSIAAGFYTQGTASNAVTGLAVTNNSTLAYPKVIGRWAVAPFQAVQSNFLLEAICVHRSGKDAKPVAAVKFTVTDGTSTETVTVTTMTISTIAGVGSAAANKVLVYAATIPIAAFIQGAVLTCNFIAYPWVGDSGALLDSASGITPPDERLCPHLLLCDKNSTYGGGCAVVDAVNGQASALATWTYASQAAAEAAYATANTNSYNTIGRAAAAIKAYNNTNLSRNEPGGGVILLTGTHDWPGTTNGTTLGVQNTWLTITRHSGTVRASAIVNGIGTSGINAQRVKFFDITLFANATTEAIRGTSVTTDAFWIDDCTLDMSTGGNSALGTIKTGYATRNAITALTGGFLSFSTLRSPYALIRGNAGPAAAGPTGAAGIQGAQYAFLGNYNLRPLFHLTGNSPGHAISDNTLVAFNTHYAGTTPWHTKTGTGTATTIAHGNAYVQNLVELQDNASWSYMVDGASGDAPANNILVWHNVSAGARNGVGYNEVGTVAFLKTNYSLVGNLFEEYAHKDDTFTPADGNRTGSWSIGYHVGCYGNHRLEANLEWYGEFSGLSTVDGGTWAYVDNAAHDAGAGGDDTGNGNYHLGSTSSAYTLMPSAVLPYDLEGTPRSLTGGSAGAFEMVSGSIVPIVMQLLH